MACLGDSMNQDIKNGLVSLILHRCACSIRDVPHLFLTGLLLMDFWVASDLLILQAVLQCIITQVCLLCPFKYQLYNKFLGAVCIVNHDGDCQTPTEQDGLMSPAVTAGKQCLFHHTFPCLLKSFPVREK